MNATVECPACAGTRITVNHWTEKKGKCRHCAGSGVICGRYEPPPTLITRELATRVGIVRP